MKTRLASTRPLPSPGVLFWLCLAGATAVTSGCQSSSADADSHSDSACWRVATVPGPEDLALDTRENRFLVSSQERRRKPRPRGAIYAVSLDSTEPAHWRELPLAGRDACSFHPPGISLVHQGGDGATLLYVINHHTAEDTSSERACLPVPGMVKGARGFTSIEVYEVEPRRLRFLQRHADPEVLKNGNDLVALENGDAFITAPTHRFWEQLQELKGAQGLSQIVRLRCSRGEDLRCDGELETVARVGRLVNGIEARRSRDGHPMLYVASTLEPVIYEFRVREEAEPLWVPSSQLDATFGLDNLAWTGPNRRELLSPAHSDIRKLLQHARTAEVTSPSEIWLLPLDGGVSGPYPSPVSAASSALCHAGDLIVGQVFDNAVLRCRASRLCLGGAAQSTATFPVSELLSAGAPSTVEDLGSVGATK